MASYNQNPLGQAPVSTSFSNHTFGSQVTDPYIEYYLVLARIISGQGAGDVNLIFEPSYVRDNVLPSVRPRWRRELKTIGAAI